MNIEDYMRPISDAARIVKASLPSGHGFELSDLVSIGAERVLRYVAGTPGASPVLAFICAKHGMQYEARRWSGKDPHGAKGEKARKSPDPILTGYHEWAHVTPTPPYEVMIDTKRALLSMQLREAVSWYSHHWLMEDLDHLENELGVSEGRIRQYCASAREKLRAAWIGEWFETEEQKATREASRVATRDQSRARANEAMLAERRRRRRELRALGLGSGAATRAAGSQHRYATALRQLTQEATP